MSFGYADASPLGTDAVLIQPQRSIGPFVAHITVREVHTDELEITEHPVDQGAAIADHAFKKPAQLMIEAVWSDSPQISYEPPPAPPRPSLETTLKNAALSAVAPFTNLASGIGDIVGTVGNLINPPPLPAAPAIDPALLTGDGVDQVRDLYQKLLELQESRIPFDVLTGKRAYANMLVQSLVVTTDAEHENSLRVTANLRQILIAQVTVRTIAAPPIHQRFPESTAPQVDKGEKHLLSSALNFNPQAALRAGIDAAVDDITQRANSAINTKITDLIDTNVSGLVSKLV